MLNQIGKLVKVMDFKILIKDHSDGMRIDIIMNLKGDHKNQYNVTPITWFGPPEVLNKLVVEQLQQLEKDSANELNTLSTVLSQEIKKAENEAIEKAKTGKSTSTSKVEKKPEAPSLFDDTSAKAKPTVSKPIPKEEIEEAYDDEDDEDPEDCDVCELEEDGIEEIVESDGEQEDDEFQMDTPATASKTAGDTKEHPQGNDTPDWAQNIAKQWDKQEIPKKL